ncbi:MAG: C40 family peptidase [Muribaculaceae bacterium]|nr:C40 family peptidase [Muribaculaceae bacterium]
MRPVRLLIAILCLLTMCEVYAQQMALVKVPVACIRTNPGHSSELSSQIVLGTPVEVTSQAGDWYQVRTPDGYSGYVMYNSLAELTEEEYEAWKKTDKVVCRSWLSRLITADGAPAGYATYGVILEGIISPGLPDMVSISMPGGSVAFASADDFYLSIEEYLDECAQTDAEEVLSVAYSMSGVPYLWGGTSTLAADCSGFTQIAYRAAGLLLPRDTSMQIKCGEPVASMQDALPGDLIFYGNSAGRVNHVAIYLGGGKIIHSSGHVRICRMSDEVPGSEDLFTNKPLSVRRVLGVANPVGVKYISQSSFYF